MAGFAETCATRAICVLMGLPEEARPLIETALDGLGAYAAEVVTDRRQHPRDDQVTTLLRPRRTLRLFAAVTLAAGLAGCPTRCPTDRALAAGVGQHRAGALPDQVRPGPGLDSTA